MYIKNYNELTLGHEQKWRYAPLQYGSVSTERILELCAHKEIEKVDVAIVKFLALFPLVPTSLIRKCVSEVKDLDDEQLNKLLHKLVRYRILNSCVFTDEIAEHVSYDNKALEFYCLDMGGTTLLKGVHESILLEEWRAVDAKMTGLQAKRLCMLIEFYHRIKTEIPEKIIYVKSHCLYGMDNRRVAPKLEIGIKDDENNENVKTYLVEMITDEDGLQKTDSEIFAKFVRYSYLLDDSSDYKPWKKFFPQSEKVPTILVLSDSKRSANIIASQVESLGIKNIRYYIKDESRPLNLNFLRYKDNEVVNVNLVAFKK